MPLSDHSLPPSSTLSTKTNQLCLGLESGAADILELNGAFWRLLEHFGAFLSTEDQSITIHFCEEEIQQFEKNGLVVVKNSGH